MGDINQKIYLQKYVTEVDGPVLEIGSRDFGNTSSFRDKYVRYEYVGVDLEGGKGVDHVVDLTQGTGPLKKNYFSLAICCSVLEHVGKPWIMAENVTNVIRPGGILYMSVPWVWRYHPHPDDYYRFSWRGVMEIFPAFEWKHICFSSSVPDEFFDVTEQITYQADNKLMIKEKAEGGERKYLPYLMVNMLGYKK